MHDMWDYGYHNPEMFEKKTPEICEQLMDRQRFSPDFKKLRLQENILVFVYDNFKQEGGYNKVLSESKYLGHGVSCTEFYTLRGFRIPVLFNNEMKQSPCRGKIRGEVYAVPPETLLKLDKHKMNGFMFKREVRHFFLPDQDYRTPQGYRSPSVSAWVYYGVEDFWKDSHLPIMPLFKIAGMPEKKYYNYDVDKHPHAVNMAEQYRLYMFDKFKSGAIDKPSH